MNRCKAILGMITLCCAISSTALAGEQATASGDLPKQVEQMECLVGEWRGTASMTMGTDKAKLEVSLSCARTSGGYGVMCKTRFTGLPTGPYEETDLFGYDPHTDKYHWFSVTNAGEAHDHVADVPKGATINWVYRGKMDGKKFTETIAMTFNKDSTKISFVNDGIVGKRKLWTMTGKLTKK